MTKTLNIGVIGCGYWGKYLIRNFVELGALHSICDFRQDLLSHISSQYPGIKASNDYQSLLCDSEVKAVVIATDARNHFPIAKDALLAGKDVFVEKPLALTSSDGETLIQIAEKQKKILMVGHLLEYHPAIIRLKEIIDNGTLGKLHYIYSNRLNLGKVRREENILWSFAPHDISVILYLLGEMPTLVSASGGNYLQHSITDVTVTNLSFASGVKAHIFVSWLHPYKEQKLVIIGDKKMAVFDDVIESDKLVLYDRGVDWINREPIPRKERTESLEFDRTEPLRRECEHFIEVIESREQPHTDGHKGLKVLEILEACQLSLENNGNPNLFSAAKNKEYFSHQTSVIDQPCEIGEGTKMWHFSHIMKNSRIGKNCNIGQNVVICPGVVIGNNVKIQNNVSVYTGVILEDDVFCGPSSVFTNVTNPRSHIPRKDEFKKTVVRKGASIGANSTIVCGVEIGKYAFIGAGAIVTNNVPDYALVYGNPAKIGGWMCSCGIKLDFKLEVAKEQTVCKVCGNNYSRNAETVEEL